MIITFYVEGDDVENQIKDEIFKPPIENPRIEKIYHIIEDYFRLCRGLKAIWNDKLDNLTPHRIDRSRVQQEKLKNVLRIIRDYKINNEKTIMKLIKLAIKTKVKPLKEDHKHLLIKILKNPHLRIKDILNEKYSKSGAYKIVRNLKRYFAIRYQGVIDYTRFKLKHMKVLCKLSNNDGVDNIIKNLRKNPLFISMNLTRVKNTGEKIAWLSFRFPENVSDEAINEWFQKAAKIYKLDIIDSPNEVTGIEYAINIKHFDGIRWRYKPEDEIIDEILSKDNTMEYHPIIQLDYAYQPIKFDEQDIIIAHQLSRKYFLKIDETIEMLRMFGFSAGRGEVLGRIKFLRECCIRSSISILLYLPITILVVLSEVLDNNAFRRFLSLVPRIRSYKLKRNIEGIYICQIPEYQESMFMSIIKRLEKEKVFSIDKLLVLHLEEVIRNPLPESLAMFWKSVEQKWPNLDELTY